MKPHLLKIAAALAVISVLLGNPTVSLCEDDLMIYPTRVVMADSQRSAQVDIVNGSHIQGTYRITLVNKRMSDTGDFQDVVTPEPDEKFADDLVRFSPRQVTLLPGAGQTIRMMFKTPPNLPEGEYRSHLLFKKAPVAVTDLQRKDEKEPNSISMKVTANIGVSIPVIVRHGALTAQASIDPASVTVKEIDGKQCVSFVLGRKGNRSIYGDVAVFLGREKIAVGNGLSVYTPNPSRKVVLRASEQYHLKHGDALRLAFTEKDQGKPMAETTVVVP